MSADVLREAAFRVVRGDPTPDELGALMAVLTVLRARAEAADDAVAEPCAPRASWDRAGNGYRSPLAWVV
ncbi:MULTISPECIES: acyl-CoA carboxylase subunit epsilon [unclassified Streptomyces]|uniref:acyl-CoA carboxylase subunit epsilon n=1 Tax=unclassified Streptomyces TaxID=2593676 RepID=UPI002251E384|nr:MULTISPECIES: acyl-CoA carboxylase subunit epsilon [unclassified Streptomyces]MCX5286555.1 acyl-CoA carboxylase subunit epsilon [Streptomyces sp. NBC_00183]